MKKEMWPELLVVTVLLTMPFATAAILGVDYTIQVNSPSQVNNYEGDIIHNTFTATITNTGDTCGITCDFTMANYYKYANLN